MESCLSRKKDCSIACAPESFQVMSDDAAFRVGKPPYELPEELIGIVGDNVSREM